MQHLEAPVIPLAAQSDLVKDKGLGKIGQMPIQLRDPMGDILLGQSPCQGQVKAELFQDIRVAPFKQQSLLPRAQARATTARKLVLASGRAKPVEIANTSLRNPLQILRIALRDQGQKPAQTRQLQPLALRRGKPVGQRCNGGLQFLGRAPFRQTKWGLQCAMEPVFARCHGDVTQTMQKGLIRLAARHHIPSEPRRPEIGQRPLGRYKVNCKTRV